MARLTDLEGETVGRDEGIAVERVSGLVDGRGADGTACFIG